MTSPPLLLARCAVAQGCFPPPRREIETGRGLSGALLVQGALAGRLELGADRVRSTGRGDTGDPARVRDAVREPAGECLPAVAAGALLVACGLHVLAWPGRSAAEAARRTAGAVASLGAAGAPVALAAAAVADSRTSSAAVLAFHG